MRCRCGHALSSHTREAKGLPGWVECGECPCDSFEPDVNYIHWPVYDQGQWHPACTPTATTGNWLAEHLSDVDCPDCLLILERAA